MAEKMPGAVSALKNPITLAVKNPKTGLICGQAVTLAKFGISPAISGIFPLCLGWQVVGIFAGYPV